MRKILMLNPKIAAEDVEIITWRHQTLRRMENEYRNYGAEERRRRRKERQKAERRRIRICAKVFAVIVSCLVGTFLAKGDLVSGCACIIMALLGCSAVAANTEYENE